MANGIYPNPMANANAIGQLIGGGIGLYSNYQQQQAAKERQAALAQQQVQALNLLGQSQSLIQSNPDEARNLFLQAYQLAPEFVNKAMAGLQSQQKLTGAGEGMTPYQRETLDLRRSQQELDRLKMAASEETNNLRRQQLNAQIAKTEQEVEAKRSSAEKSASKGVDLAREAASLARDIAGSESLADATGTVSTMFPVVRGETQDLINKALRLESLLTYENLGLMSGVLTDRDIQFLGRIGSGLNITDSGIKGSTKAVQNRLNDIAGKIESALGGAEKNDETTEETVVFTSDRYGDVTEADIQETMKANGISREEVLRRLGAK